jgi:hypothetical protein
MEFERVGLQQRMELERVGLQRMELETVWVTANGMLGMELESSALQRMEFERVGL